MTTVFLLQKSREKSVAEELMHKWGSFGRIGVPPFLSSLTASLM